MADSHVVMQSKGYEHFKEYWSAEAKKRGEAAAAAGLPSKQDILSTIEIGMSPFVPFSQQFKMHSAKVGEGWGVGAGPQEGSPTKAWGKTLSRPKAINPQLRGDNELGVRETPRDEILESAEELARTISFLLQNEGIAQEANTTVRDELQSQALALYVKETYDAKHWQSHGAKSVIGTIKPIIEENLKKVGGETWDMYAKGESGMATLEMSLHMLHRELDDKMFIKGVRSFEQSTMQGEKWFQKQFTKFKTEANTVEQAMEKGAQKSIEKFLKDYGVLNNKLIKHIPKGGGTPTVSSVGGKPIPPGSSVGGEDFNYFAKQLGSRLFELQESSNMFGSGKQRQDLGNAFIFQMPVPGDAYSSAYIKISMEMKGGLITSVTAKAAIVGGGAFEKMLEGHRTYTDDKGAVHEIFHKTAAGSWGTHTQLMMFSLLKEAEISHKHLFEMSGAMGVTFFNELALGTGKRLDTIGMGLKNNMEVTLGNTVASSLALEGTEVIGARTATDFVKSQVESLLSDAKTKMVPELEDFYKQAMKKSQEATNSWVEMLQMKKQRLTSRPQGPYATSKGFFSDEQNLSGVGIPFWFTIGRDPSGFEKFRRQQTHGKKKWEEEGISMKNLRLEGPLSEPLALRTGTGKNIRGPMDPANAGLAGKFFSKGQTDEEIEKRGFGWYDPMRQEAYDPTERRVEGTGGWKTKATQDPRYMTDPDVWGASDYQPRTIEEIISDTDRTARGFNTT